MQRISAGFVRSLAGESQFENLCEDRLSAYLPGADRDPAGVALHPDYLLNAEDICRLRSVASRRISVRKFMRRSVVRVSARSRSRPRWRCAPSGLLAECRGYLPASFGR